MVIQFLPVAIGTTVVVLPETEGGQVEGGDEFRMGLADFVVSLEQAGG